jgi:putative nucleotidyltransferase with HDIG domain
MSTLRARKLIQKNITIPTLPAVVQRVQAMIEDPNTGPKELGDVVAEDAPISARVLKIANSAYYGLRERCLVPQHATAVLGVRVLRNVVTQAAVISQYEHLKGGEFDLDALWRHSILVAQSCSFLGKRRKTTVGLSPDELYVCGLLHDLGKVVMLECLKDDYLDVVRWAHEAGLPDYAAETQRLGFTHTDVGAIVAQQWGLPPQVGAAIQHHHGPREAIATDPVAAIVASVNLIVDRVEEGNAGAATMVIDAPTGRLLGVSPEDTVELVEFVRESMATVVV